VEVADLVREGLELVRVGVGPREERRARRLGPLGEAQKLTEGAAGELERGLLAVRDDLLIEQAGAHPR
jgi:hypothetical protein